MKLLKDKKLIITEAAMTAALVLVIFLFVRGGVRDDLALTDISSRLLTAVSGGENMKDGDAMKLKALYGLSENDYAEVLLYVPASNMDAQELLLIRCRFTEQTKEVEAAMRKRVNDQKNTFESYGVEQMALIEKAVIDIKGNYCLYVCDPGSYEVQDIFDSIVKK